ncbi:MAG TPA: pirin family protein [Micromonosporaceae bacterium]|nr:pirin family protein [Micromonosporaceae bacterium]
MAVTRTLPNRTRRMVGGWCFLDHFGPEDVAGGPGMRVAPHPHTGLQTVTWLVDGEVLHRDSLGSRQLVRPGQLNVMTAGHGIAHSEESPPDRSPVLHGVQLWAAMPDPARHGPSSFAHHPDLPVLTDGDVRAEGEVRVTVMVGEVAGVASPARTFTPLVGAELQLAPGAAARLPLRPDFEYAVLALSGRVEVEGVAVDPGPLLYLGSHRHDLALRAAVGARALLLGGEPFGEQIVMWWNFVGRNHDEIVRSREDWTAGRRFGTVHGYDGPPLPAPPLPATRLRPRGRER